MSKNTTVLLAGLGLLGYLGYRAKVNAEKLAQELAARNALPPPPPNGGPVVNGLSFYELEGLGGFGSKFKAAVSKVTAPVQQVHKTIVNTVKDPKKVGLAVATGGASLIAEKASGKDITEKVKLPFVRKAGSAPQGQPEAGQEEVYQDINGKNITKAEYDAIIKAMQSMTPIPVGDGWAVPDGYVMTKTQYESSAYFPRPKVPGHGTADNTQSPPWRPTYQRGGGNDNLDVKDTYSNDYNDPYSTGPRTSYTAPSAGSPGLPQGLTTTMAPPAVQEAPAQTFAPEPKSNTAAAVVGTALAAGAAYLAFS